MPVLRPELPVRSSRFPATNPDSEPATGRSERTENWELGASALANFYLYRLRRNEFATTDTEEKAMAAAAIIGLRRPNAARGIAATL